MSSSRHELNSSLSIREDWFETFINNSPAIAWLTDEHGNLVMMNRAFKDLMGLDQNAVRKSMWDLFPAELASQYHANNMEVLRTNEILKTQEISIDKFGNRRTFIVCKFPVNTKDEQRLIGGWSIDITDQKEAEQKVLEHSERLREIAFLQSHEVRRPLSNILSLIELIGENGDINGEIRGSHIVDYLKQSATELDDVIRKIMLKTRS